MSDCVAIAPELSFRQQVRQLDGRGIWRRVTKLDTRGRREDGD
jgi:hypothetical protein